MEPQRETHDGELCGRQHPSDLADGLRDLLRSEALALIDFIKI